MQLCLHELSGGGMVDSLDLVAAGVVSPDLVATVFGLDPPDAVPEPLEVRPERGGRHLCPAGGIGTEGIVFAGPYRSRKAEDESGDACHDHTHIHLPFGDGTWRPFADEVTVGGHGFRSAVDPCQRFDSLGGP